MKRLISMLAALALPGLAAGQMTQSQPVPPATQQKASTTKSGDAHATVETRLRAELNRIEAGITKLEKSAESEGKVIPQDLQALRDQAKAVEAKLSALTNAGAKEWSAVEADARKSMKDLRRAYHEFGSAPSAGKPAQKPATPQP